MKFARAKGLLSARSGSEIIEGMSMNIDLSKLVIENNVPIAEPRRGRGGVSRNPIYKIAYALLIGESVLVPITSKVFNKSGSSKVLNSASRKRGDVKFVTRQESTGVRIHCVSGQPVSSVREVESIRRVA